MADPKPAKLTTTKPKPDADVVLPDPVLTVRDADGNVVCEVPVGEGVVLEDGWTAESN